MVAVREAKDSTKTKGKKSGIEAVTDKEIAKLNNERIPENTKKATSWLVPLRTKARGI